ncbi:hypothetical protein RRG08_004369 [Elysia crispata]|uniref:Uncharacterized protein n=1 Tax=Elysia crispata TaxID=231223 RepID=A0AAE0Z7C9_9GAST|nr:hypothetical protein RRG08_004369 [Elysia crispata]
MNFNRSSQPRPREYIEQDKGEGRGVEVNNSTPYQLARGLALQLAVCALSAAAGRTCHPRQPLTQLCSPTISCPACGCLVSSRPYHRKHGARTATIWRSNLVSKTSVSQGNTVCKFNTPVLVKCIPLGECSTRTQAPHRADQQAKLVPS